ncbi:MAG TPA: helix-turn-helix domain-containing protein, partial [Calditerricola sp.]
QAQQGRGCTGVPHRPKLPGTEQEKQQALAMVAAGYSYRAIARILGRDHHTIKRWADAAEDEVRQMHEQLKREFAVQAWAKIFDLLGYLDADKMARMNGRDLTWAMGVLFDKAITAMAQSKLAEAQQQQDADKPEKQQPVINIVIDEKVAKRLQERRMQENAGVDGKPEQVRATA